jgi:hypothetical protein
MVIVIHPEIQNSMNLSNTSPLPKVATAQSVPLQATPPAVNTPSSDWEPATSTEKAAASASTKVTSPFDPKLLTMPAGTPKEKHEKTIHKASKKQMDKMMKLSEDLSEGKPVSVPLKQSAEKTAPKEQATQGVAMMAQVSPPPVQSPANYMQTQKEQLMSLITRLETEEKPAPVVHVEKPVTKPVESSAVQKEKPLPKSPAPAATAKVEKPLAESDKPAEDKAKPSTVKVQHQPAKPPAVSSAIKAQKAARRLVQKHVNQFQKRLNDLLSFSGF